MLIDERGLLEASGSLSDTSNEILKLPYESK